MEIKSMSMENKECTLKLSFRELFALMASLGYSINEMSEQTFKAVAIASYAEGEHLFKEIEEIIDSVPDSFFE